MQKRFARGPAWKHTRRRVQRLKAQCYMLQEMTPTLPMRLAGCLLLDV